MYLGHDLQTNEENKEKKGTQINKWSKQNKLIKIKLCYQNKRKTQTSNSNLTQKTENKHKHKRRAFFYFLFFFCFCFLHKYSDC